MKKMSLTEIAEAIKCRAVIGGETALLFDKVSTDTRNIKTGDLFIALIGERFDAHEFLAVAVQKGASALVVSQEPKVNLAVPVLLVDDTLKALQDLGNYNRRQFDIPVIGITGSNGKTTTKDMVAAVLGEKFGVLKTQGNFNNEIGLPLTLLELNETYSVAVIEMGMRGLGEIDLLSKLTEPTGVIITSIGETHLERLGSIENIAKAKSEILNHLKRDGFAVLNGEDQRIQKIGGEFKGKSYFYGFNPNCELWAEDIRLSANGGQTFKVHLGRRTQEFMLPLPGKHNVLNSLAAIMIGLQLGLEPELIAKGLANLKLSSMRLEVIEGKKFKIINDAYNANPASVKASIGILKDLGRNSRTIAVLGDMYELGDRTEEGHKEVGRKVAEVGIDILIGVGKLTSNIVAGAREVGFPESNLFYCETKDEADKVLDKIGHKGDVILIKGSRGMKMEELIQGRI